MSSIIHNPSGEMHGYQIVLGRSGYAASGALALYLKHEMFIQTTESLLIMDVDESWFIKFYNALPEL